MVFMSRTMGADIWSMAIDPERGITAGLLSRVTQDAADDYRPSLSEDGATLVFRSRRGGHFGVVLRKLASSAETVLTRMPQDHSPAISRDGTKVAYSFPQNGKMPIFVVDAAGRDPATGVRRLWRGRGMVGRGQSRFCMSRATIRRALAC